jgi:hypothetical protein
MKTIERGEGRGERKEERRGDRKTLIIMPYSFHVKRKYNRNEAEKLSTIN